MPKPRFTYDIRIKYGMHEASIRADGQLIHVIENVNTFYETFGYNQEVARNGILPDEYLWEEYIHKPVAELSACFQMLIVKYLKAHSDIFNRLYGNEIEHWIAAHAELRPESGVLCVACKMKPFCGVHD